MISQLVISLMKKIIKQGKSDKYALPDQEVRKTFRMVPRDVRASDQQCPLPTALIYGKISCAGTNATPRRNWLALVLQRLSAQDAMRDNYFINSGI